MNYTYKEYLEAKRGGRMAKKLKNHIKTSWDSSDSRASFEAALERGGLYLAQGTRRGFVCVDFEGNIYSLSRWSGVKRQQLTEQLGEPEVLQSVEQVRNDIAERMSPRLEQYIDEATSSYQHQLDDLLSTKAALVESQRIERDELIIRQDENWCQRCEARAAEYSNGLRGLWGRVTGKHKQLVIQHEREEQRETQKDRQALERLDSKHLQHRERLQSHIDAAKEAFETAKYTLFEQLAEYRTMRIEPPIAFEPRVQAEDQRQSRSFNLDQ